MKDLITGKKTDHLIVDEQSHLLVHRKMLPALKSLRDEAHKNGFFLEMTSAFRSFDQQLSIWNNKSKGLRPLYDDAGELLDYKILSPKEIMLAILRWSALPGASRHHWGTDIDVFDKSRMPPGCKVQLLPEETVGDGYFAEFHLWLDKNLDRFDFFRPYSIDKGGIAPERWHISYRPVSNEFQKKLTYNLIESTIESSEIELKSLILEELPLIYHRFIDI